MERAQGLAGEPEGEDLPSSGPRAGGGEAQGPWRWVLGGALVLALLRFARLGDWGLWIDEAHTLHDALSSGGRAARSYPLGYWATSLAVELRGGRTDEATLRLAPAAFGVVSIALTVWAFSPAIGRLRSACAALLVSLSAWHVFWSQSARGYTLALALALLGTGIWLRGVLSGRTALLACGLAAAAIACFAHPSGALLLAALLAAPLLARLVGDSSPVRGRALSRTVLVACAVLFLAALAPWAAPVWRQYQSFKARGGGASGLAHFALTCGYHFGPLLLLAAAAGAWRGWRARATGDVYALLVAALVAAAGAVAAYLARASAQYVFALLPWLAALASGAAVAGGARGGPPRLRKAVLVPLVVWGGLDLGSYFFVRHGDRPRWREAYAWVWSRREPDDLVFGMHGPVGEYYFAPGKTAVRAQEAFARLDSFSSRGPARAARYARRTWIVLNREDLETWPAGDRADFQVLLREDYRCAAEFPVRWTPRDLGVEVWLRE